MTEIKETTLPCDDRGNDPSAHRVDSDYTRRILSTASPIAGAPATVGPTLRRVPAALAAAIPPIRHVIEHILPRQHVTLLGGHGGSGKSLLKLILAAHCAAGKPWAGLSALQTRTLCVQLEDPADLVRLRLRRIVAEYNLPAEAIEGGD